MLTKSSYNEAVKPIKAEEITLHTGEDVWALLSGASFKNQWDTLYGTCPWATVFQSRAFVTTWYETYREKYKPVVIKAEHSGKLTGLLTLAAPASKKGRIVGAGQYEAEYQVWLTLASDDGSFIKTALRMVLQQFPDLDIQLRYIPPQAPLNWIREAYWKSRCVLEPYSRPLMEMSDPRTSKMTSKTEFRNKFNRLKRLGPVSLERITDKEQFSTILDELIIQYDFRQGAMFNKNQFLDEPLKADLLLALFEQNLLHVSVLKVKEQIYSAIVAIDGRDWVHLGGINIHSPFQAKFYSPGFVHFILLGQELLKNGVAVFDLTPGGDFYKERMATRHDQVHELVVAGSFSYRVKRVFRKQYHKALLKAGKWPMGVELSVRKKLYLLKARVRGAKKAGLLRTAFERIHNTLHPAKNKVYMAFTHILVKKEDLLIQKNALKDLLQYEPLGSRLTRWEFLEDAMRRFEVGQASYSFCGKGRLLGCVWLSERKAAGAGPASLLPDGARVLEGFYCHPDGHHHLGDFTAAVAGAVVMDPPEGPLYAQATSRDKHLCQVLEALGFEEVGAAEMKPA